MINLLMLSGGFDSCALLIRELKTTKKFIHVHHTRLMYLENRHEPEEQAVEKIIKHCKKIREFRYSSSVFRYPSFHFVVADVVLMANIASTVARSLLEQQYSIEKKCDELKILIGIITDDAGPRDEWYKTYRGIAADKVVDSYFHDYPERGLIKPVIEYPFLNENKSKAEIIKYIPKELRRHLFTCRNPLKLGNKFVVCNDCKSCKVLKGAV